MNRKQLWRKIVYAFQYVPFTLNSLLFAIGVWLCYYFLYKPVPKNAAENTDSFRQLIIAMAKVAMWFVVVLVGLSILSTFITWLIYLIMKKDNRYDLKVDFTTETKNDKKNRLYLNAVIAGIRRPVLGFVKGRLFYDDQRMTDKFSLLSNKRKEQGFWREGIMGKSRLLLPDIKEYSLRGGIVYFEDMLHLFSLAVKQDITGQFYQPPVLAQDEDREVFPKKTETLDVRIEQMRRVEGDYLHYKDFEAGDDVRRIVWKVYARNRELVVRMPEMFEPYASHLYFYASFEAAVKAQWLGDGYMKEMLNYYKNRVWTVYDTLAKKDWEMRFIPDQKMNVPEHLSPAEKAMRTISNSDWQQDTPLGSYFSVRNGTVLCISSLTDTNELEKILSQCDGSTVVYFVKLSKTFRHFVPLGWLGRLLFIPPKDRLARLRTNWIFSPMRLQVQKREKEIEALLKKSSVVSGVL